MKKRLKLTPFAKVFIVVLIILGARYVYLNQEGIELEELNSFEEIKKKAQDLFQKEDKKTSTIEEDVAIHRIDTVIIEITDSNNIIKISSSGKTVNKLKSSNIQDTLFFNISEEKALVGKIIYKQE